MEKKLLKKFLSFSYGTWIGLILGVLTTMITTRLLLPESLGKASMYDLFIQVGLIFVIFGTDQSFTRFFYEEERKKRGALLYNSIKLPLVSLSLIIILILLFYKPITIFLFNIKSFKLAVLLAIGLAAQLFFRYGLLVIRMQQKGNLYSLVHILHRLFNLIFIVLFFYFLKEGFEVLVYSKVVTLLLLVIVAIYIGRDYWNINNLNVGDTKHTQADIIKYGFPFLFTLFITWIFETFDRIAIRHWSDFTELGMYSAAMRLVALVVVLQTTFRTFWTPIAFERFEENPNDKNFFKQMTTLVSFVMFLVAIGSIMCKDIVVILLGSEYKEASSLMPFLVFMPVMYTLSETTVIGINFYKKSKWHIPIALISSFANIIGNWLLVPNFGALGASISTAFSYIIFFTLRTIISLKFYKINYSLGKIYVMTIIVSCYAFYAINNSSILMNILIGLIPITALIIIYIKDIYVFLSKKFFI